MTFSYIVHIPYTMRAEGAVDGQALSVLAVFVVSLDFWRTLLVHPVLTNASPCGTQRDVFTTTG